MTTRHVTKEAARRVSWRAASVALLAMGCAPTPAAPDNGLDVSGYASTSCAFRAREDTVNP